MKVAAEKQAATSNKTAKGHGCMRDCTTRRAAGRHPRVLLSSWRTTQAVGRQREPYKLPTPVCQDAPITSHSGISCPEPMKPSGALVAP